MSVIAEQFPKLHARMSGCGVKLNVSAGYSRRELNNMLCPLGFPVIGEDQTLLQVLVDAESYLTRLDGASGE